MISAEPRDTELEWFLSRITMDDCHRGGIVWVATGRPGTRQPVAVYCLTPVAETGQRDEEVTAVTTAISRIRPVATDGTTFALLPLRARETVRESWSCA